MFWETKIARYVLYGLVVDVIFTHYRSVKRTRGNEITRIVFFCIISFPHLYIVVSYKNMVLCILNIICRVFVSVNRLISTYLLVSKYFKLNIQNP